MRKFEPDSWTPAVNVTTWLFMITAILSIFTRLGTKYWIFRRFTTDDYLSIVSVVACVGESVAVSMATANGYGEHYESLSEANMGVIMKSQYAGTILFLTSICFSKSALITFIRNITPFRLDRSFAFGVEVFTILWAVTGIITAALQCKPPQAWNYLHGECFNIGAWWNYLGVTNILSETTIIVQAVVVIVRVQAPWRKKVTLGTVFGLRIFVIAAIVCQLVFNARTANSPDSTSDTSPATIATQAAQCLSIVTACSPQFKPFMDSLRSTGMRAEGMTKESSRKQYRSSLSHMKTTLFSQDNSLTPSQGVELSVISRDQDGDQAFATAARSVHDSDAESHHSQAHIIREARTWTVTEPRRTSARYYGEQ
ncbi:hypothetical protein BDV23DRAFT_178216 [Aspergillus alliaceus]|uniref:Rhodopsin domain-containing protein n=1 Tax=Petromyces alliaceus TaxID=209559 RepID=A0A5N7CPG2_PETAA|nr:hypothetical protein BDV23DRAFT_178216 [Aspergillus alliaceus]